MEKKRACIISSEIVGPHANGGVGTHCFYLAGFLSRQLGQEVTFLYTGKIERRTEAYWKEWFQSHLGIEFVWLPAERKLDPMPVPLRSTFVRTARLVYDWLRKRQFDVCYFQEMLGNGFRCFQAKRLGLAFQDTVLTCTVHSSWEWICQAMQTFPQHGMEEVQTKFIERYCIEHCDLLISPSEYMLRWLDQNRVRTPARKQLLPYLFDPELQPAGSRPGQAKIIFFGRLEVRKGLLLFLEALLAMDRRGAFVGRPVEVIFLGKSGYTPDGGGTNSIEKFQPRFSAGVKFKPVTELGHSAALDFLRANNDALVVCPSLVDNSPYAIIESLQLGLNLIAANSGGIPELFAGTERLFEPEPEALAKKIRAGLDGALPPAKKRYDLQRAAALWREFAENTVAEAAAAPRPRPPRETPRVALLAPGESDESTPKRMRELAQTQTYKPVEVVSSTGAQPGELVLFVAPNCTPEPELVSRLVAALQYSGLEALTCCAKVGTEDGGEGSFIYEPLGPCLEGGAFMNLFGTGCLLMRLKAGVTPESLDRLFRPEGLWACLAEMSVQGRAWDVCPEVLINMATAEPSFSETGVDYTGHAAVLESYFRNSPMWLRYLIVNAVASERAVLGIGQKREETNSHPKPVLYKLKRETRRIFRQCRSLFARP